MVRGGHGRRAEHAGRAGRVCRDGEAAGGDWLGPGHGLHRDAEWLPVRGSRGRCRRQETGLMALLVSEAANSHAMRCDNIVCRDDGEPACSLVSCTLLMKYAGPPTTTVPVQLIRAAKSQLSSPQPAPAQLTLRSSQQREYAETSVDILRTAGVRAGGRGTGRSRNRITAVDRVLVRLHIELDATGCLARSKNGGCPRWLAALA